MHVDLFIRSYYKDFRWLVYALRSVSKYARGFRKTVLVVPRSSAGRLAQLHLGELAEIHFCEDFDDDYLGQQVTKLHADQYTDADFICHLDSDCLFRVETRPEHLICNGKAVVLFAAYSDFPEQRQWQQITEAFMRRPVAHDFMRRQPLVFPRSLYAGCRQYAETIHHESLRAHIVSRPPRGFSEFNALGAFAYYFSPGDFIWQQCSTWIPDESICRWYWSWAGVSRETEEELNAILT